MYFLLSSINTFINDIEPIIKHQILKVDQTRATPDTMILMGRIWIPTSLNT